MAQQASGQSSTQYLAGVASTQNMPTLTSSPQQDYQASAPLSRISALLERYVSDGILTRSMQDLYSSRYQKAYDMLAQLIYNEYVHVYNIADEQRELGVLDEQIAAEYRKQAQFAQYIFKLRQDLYEQEASIFQQQDGSTKFSNEHTLLAEEKMVLEQEIDFVKRERAEQLRPQIALLETYAKELREAIFNAQVVEKYKQAEIMQNYQNIEAVDAACRITRDELSRAQADLARAYALPEKYKRYISLIKYSYATAQADCDRRDTKVKGLDAETQKLRYYIEAVEGQTKDVSDYMYSLRNDLMVYLYSDLDFVTKQVKSHKFELRDLNEIYQSLSKKANSAKLNRFLIQQQVEQLQHDISALEKKEYHKEAAFHRAEEAEAPLAERQKILQEQVDVEQTKLTAYESQITSSKKIVQDLIVQFAAKLNTDDEFQQKLLEISQLNKNQQTAVFTVIREIRDLQIQTISAYSQRSAANNKLTRYSAYLKSTLSQLTIKDAEESRLALELASIYGKIGDYSKLYEKLKTQKNRLARLSQEAKLAIAEVREKIEVLKSETEVLGKESADKQNVLATAVLATKDAYRQVSTARQTLANYKRQLREQHTAIARQISEIDALGSAISKHEATISQLMQAYFGAVEQRNYAGIQVIQRTDELCYIYEKLHTQEAIEKEAEMFMQAREEDIRTLKLVISELERDKELLQRSCKNDLPEVLAERQRQKTKLDDLRAENQQILDDIRNIAAITEDGGPVQNVLDLTSLYQENALLNGNLDQAVQQLLKPVTPGGKKAELDKKPLQYLRSSQICATWNMVGNIDSVMPEILEDKQKNIEKRMQGVRETLLEKYVLDEELTKLVEDLEKAIAQNKANVPGDALAYCNAARAKLQKVRRQLMATISSLSLEQATAQRLGDLRYQLSGELEAQANNMKQGHAPTEEIEHEWLVQQQNEIEYARAKQLREEALASQVPGLYPSKAKPRFDSYMNAETGLPRPYGTNAPMAPPEPSANLTRFYRKPKEQEIEI